MSDTKQDDSRDFVAEICALAEQSLQEKKRIAQIFKRMGITSGVDVIELRMYSDGEIILDTLIPVEDENES
jgi:hypothetical protein